MTQAQMRDELRNQIFHTGTGQQKDWAKVNGFSPAYVSDVMTGRRDVSDRLAEALGFRRVVSFEALPGKGLMP